MKEGNKWRRSNEMKMQLYMMMEAMNGQVYKLFDELRNEGIMNENMKG